jgi:hypothetical protein
VIEGVFDTLKSVERNLQVGEGKFQTVKTDRIMKGRSINQNTLLLLILAGSCIALSSCTTVKSRVSRFHLLSPKGSGETFALIAARDNPGLEWKTNAVQVAQHLEKYEWRPLPSGQKGDYKVGVHCWMGGNRVQIRGNQYGVASATTHDRFLVVLIWDKNGNEVFEGRVGSEGRSSDYAAVMPQMINAMFAGFPGKSGKSRRDVRM